MKTFFRFVEHFFRIFWAVRGVNVALLCLVVLGALVISIAEGIGFADSLYFAVVTALTIGYGDITPKTTLGRVASLAIGIVGVIFVGLIVAVATRAVRYSVPHKDEPEQ
jgi:voltage-gated potassium channel